MIKEKVLNLLGMTEQQIIEEASKYNLGLEEIEALDKGKEFIDKINELNNGISIKRVVLSLITYELIKKNGGK